MESKRKVEKAEIKVMDRIKNPSIKLKRHLEYQEYEDIKSLRKYCVEQDNVALELELDYKLS